MSINNTNNISIDTDACIDRIRNLMQHAVSENMLPGAVVLVSRSGKTVFHEAFGLADRETGRPQHIDDLFYLGSTSKPLAVTSILTLVDAGKISLDDPASTWIPELDHCRLKQGRVSRVPTIRELLSHTSGLFGNATATPRQQRLVWNFGSSLAETAKKIARQPYAYEPGKGFSYGGASMTIASRIAEIITGMEFDEFAHSVLFSKLKMNNTFYRTGTEFKERFSTLYKRFKGNLHRAQFQPHASPDSFVLPAGGIISNASDLSAFLQLHLNNTRKDLKKILSHELVLEMRTDAIDGNPMDFKHAARSKHGTGIANNEGYGLGWMLNAIGDNNNANIFFHGGAFGTLVWGDAKSGLGVVLLTHIPLAEVADLWDEIIDVCSKALANAV